MANPDRQQGICDQVREFCDASLKGRWYDAFEVNSKNWKQMSAGTRNWIEEFNRLLGSCVREAASGQASEVREAFEALFHLLDRIDDGDDSFLFFADEAGSWQVGVDWRRVMPAWFGCLSTTVGPEEYASRVREVVEKFEWAHRGRHLGIARRLAPPAGRQVCSAREVRSTRGNRPGGP